MFQEEIAEITAVHLRTHIGAYLTAVQARHADTIKMQFPKTIETANLVGGVYNTTTENMPAYAIDVLNKAYAGTTDDGLWLYQYEGHIAGVIAANDEVSANALVKRHEEAVEQFVRNHLHLHNLPNPQNAEFSFTEFAFISAAFSGAESLGEGKPWIAGFRIDLTWVTSEEGPGDHES